MVHVTKPKVTSKSQSITPISLTLTPAAEQPARQQGRKKGSPPRPEDSDTDPEAPVAQQMLSFVMDDPDFESEASDTPKIAEVSWRISTTAIVVRSKPMSDGLLCHPQNTFPVRDELLSDLSEDDVQSAKVPEPLKPIVISFRHKDDADLFGLGIQEEASVGKESSEEREGKS